MATNASAVGRGACPAGSASPWLVCYVSDACVHALCGLAVRATPVQLCVLGARDAVTFARVLGAGCWRAQVHAMCASLRCEELLT